MSEGDAPKRGDGDTTDSEKFVETQYQGAATPSGSNLAAVVRNKDPLIGTTVSGYVVKGKLGSGGMGIVYEGEQPVIGKRVAIKVLRPEIAENPEQVKRLVEEARAVNTVGHRGIIDVFGFGADLFEEELSLVAEADEPGERSGEPGDDHQPGGGFGDGGGRGGDVIHAKAGAGHIADQAGGSRI